MIQLITTCVHHTVLGFCKDNARGLECLSCQEQWLTGDGCLSSRCWSCGKCGQCPVQDDELVVAWFSAVLRGITRFCNLPIDGASDFACPVESVDEKGRCFVTFTGFLQIGVAVILEEKFLRRALEVYLEFFPREQGCCK